MQVIIRADASIFIGNGHIMRCLVLAKSLRSQGYQVAFASRPQQGDLVSYIRNNGFIVHELMQPTIWLKPSHNSDYQSWLQVPWQKDAQNFIECISDADLVVVDHYGIGNKWEKKIKTHLKCKLFVIDDLVRRHDADMLLDQTLMRKDSEYDTVFTGNNILTGCEFSLINPQFSQYREDTLDFIKLAKHPRVLISMGGVDQPNATLKVLKTFEKHPYPRPEVTVLLSKKSPNYENVKSYCMQHGNWVTHFDFVENMAELMLRHSIAIGAPGTTSWERACLGIPSIIIPLAENQKKICQELVSIKAVICIELNEIRTQLLSSYYSLLAQWSEFKKANLRLCDGLGVNRVTHEVETLFKTGNKGVNLRIATTADIKKVYGWQCQPKTRQYALTPEIPSWNEHKKWMTKKLEDYDNYFYIIELDITTEQKLSVGVIRLDRKSNAYYILSISIDSKQHNKGLARNALKLIDVIHPNIKIEAIVLADNTASQKLFESVNYLRRSQYSFLREPIKRVQNEITYYN